MALLKSKLEVMLAQVGRHVRIIGKSGRIFLLVINGLIGLCIAEFIVTAQPDVLLASLLDVGLTGVSQVSLAHPMAWGALVHLIARLEVISGRVTLFLTVSQVDGRVGKILLHSLALLR